jgi:hypothetical protein
MNDVHRNVGMSATLPPTSLAIALTLAATGLLVFPCNSLKRPPIAKAKGGNGFRDASTDPDRIREMWDLSGVGAQLVGVPTGSASGFDVIDIDPRHGGHLWEAANRAQLGETRMHGTPSGGRHYLYRHVDGVRNSGAKIAPGVDVRGEGGYAIWPPSRGYTIIHEVEAAGWPPWLLRLVLKASEPPLRPAPSTCTSPAEISDRRLQGFVRAALDRVAGAVDGSKHYALRNAALQIGGVADRIGLGDTEAIGMLIAALPGAKDWDNARRTAAWGLAEGRKRPIALPDRTQFAWRRWA